MVCKQFGHLLSSRGSHGYQIASSWTWSVARGLTGSVTVKTMRLGTTFSLGEFMDLKGSVNQHFRLQCVAFDCWALSLRRGKVKCGRKREAERSQRSKCRGPWATVMTQVQQVPEDKGQQMRGKREGRERNDIFVCIKQGVPLWDCSSSGLG